MLEGENEKSQSITSKGQVYWVPYGYHHFSFITKFGEEKNAAYQNVLSNHWPMVVRDFQWWCACSLWPSCFEDFFDVAKVAILHRKSEDCP